jgi:TonB family protein
MPFPPQSPRFSLSVFLDSVANRLVSRLLYLLRPIFLIWLVPVLLLPVFLLTPVVSGRALVLLQENPPATQQAAPVQPAQNPPAAAPPAPSQPQPASSASAPEFAPITESDLQHRLTGKQLFLRGGWLGDSLNFTEHGNPVGHPATGSYTLSAIRIDKVHLTKHRVELEGSRYALHFLGALPYEDSANAVDRIRITPKKKTLKITIDREIVIKSKKASKAEKAAEKAKKKAGETPAGQPAGQAVASSESDAPAATPAPTTTQALTTTAAAPSQSQPGQAESAADLEPDKPGETGAADQASVTTTVSPAHAALILHQALDKIFATGLDESMRARMPEFWQLYYQAQAAGVDYRPKDPGILRSNAVDQQAKLLSFVAPSSNDYAQASGIAGPALYRVVVGADGNPQQIAVERPIGFGLDENAVAALRKATFQAAVKGGQPVAQTLDLTVVFRIYSQRTSQSSSDTASENSPGTPTPAPTVKPALPGPYSAKPAPAQPAGDQPAPDQSQPAQPQPDSSQPAPSQPTPSQPTQPQPDPAKPTQPQ